MYKVPLSYIYVQFDFNRRKCFTFFAEFSAASFFTENNGRTLYLSKLFGVL